MASRKKNQAKIALAIALLQTQSFPGRGNETLLGEKLNVCEDINFSNFLW